MALDAAHAAWSVTMSASADHLTAASRFSRLRALIAKEFSQIRRDRRLAISLVVPPTLQLLLFGFALDSSVSNLRMGVVDYCHSPESRELIAVMTESKSFELTGAWFSERDLSAAISRSELDAGLVIPREYSKQIARGRPATIQVLLNAVNSNTAAIGEGYAQGVLENYNRGLGGGGVVAKVLTLNTGPVARTGQVVLHPAFLFNPGLVTSWFIVTGTFGTLLLLNASIIASAAMIKERERGTIEQLLMTPAGTAEIIVAKITPLFFLLLILVVLASVIIRVVFHVPFRGDPLLVVLGGALCVLSGIGIGTFLATYTKSTQQALMLSFFINPPMASLSGALTPIEAMPRWLQPVTLFNPIRHFGVIARGVLVKGAGFDSLWPNLLALALFAIVLLTLSTMRFRKQLG
jgi:ABC-2 type transport system permease protein